MELNVDELSQTLTTLVSSWGLKVLGALAVLVIGRLVAGGLGRGARRALERAGVDASLVPFASNLVYYLALAVVVVAVLNLFGIQTASLIAVLGAAGLAVGLAMQGTLSNFAAGVMLLIFRPFKHGDYVAVAGVEGAVQEIGVFSTTLHTPDNVRITISNASIYGDTIKNYSANATRRNDLVIGISYGDDIGRALETIHKVLGADPRVLRDPEPMVAVSELGDSSVNLVVRPWCASGDYWALRFDLLRVLKEELEAAGCSIPFPQRDLHLHTNGAALA
ncbi:MAG: mechanosensitive ion channel domain-containing protein [Myxococcota bacterium]